LARKNFNKHFVIGFIALLTFELRASPFFADSLNYETVAPDMVIVRLSTSFREVTSRISFYFLVTNGTPRIDGHIGPFKRGKRSLVFTRGDFSDTRI